MYIHYTCNYSYYIYFSVLESNCKFIFIICKPHASLTIRWRHIWNFSEICHLFIFHCECFNWWRTDYIPACYACYAVYSMGYWQSWCHVFNYSAWSYIFSFCCYSTAKHVMTCFTVRCTFQTTEISVVRWGTFIRAISSKITNRTFFANVSIHEFIVNTISADIGINLLNTSCACGKK